MPITIMPLIMWDNKTKRAPVIQTVAIERMCHQIAVGCVLTETRLNSTEWPNGPQAANNGDDDVDVGSGGSSSALPVELPRHTTAAAAVAAAAVGNEQQEEAAKTESRNNKMNERN